MPKTILVVDDERHMVRLLQMNLQREGYNVVTAFDGEEALQKVGTEAPDLIILDITMPRMDGFQVLQRLREEHAGRMPVLILTARSKDSDVFKGYELGADAYLSKPLHPSELMRVVASILSRETGGDEAASRPSPEGTDEEANSGSG